MAHGLKALGLPLNYEQNISKPEKLNPIPLIQEKNKLPSQRLHLFTHTLHSRPLGYVGTTRTAGSGATNFHSKQKQRMVSNKEGTEISGARHLDIEVANLSGLT